MLHRFNIEATSEGCAYQTNKLAIRLSTMLFLKESNNALVILRLNNWIKVERSSSGYD